MTAWGRKPTVGQIQFLSHLLAGLYGRLSAMSRQIKSKRGILKRDRKISVRILNKIAQARACYAIRDLYPAALIFQKFHSLHELYGLVIFHRFHVY